MTRTFSFDDEWSNDNTLKDWAYAAYGKRSSSKWYSWKENDQCSSATNEMFNYTDIESINIVQDACDSEYIELGD